MMKKCEFKIEYFEFQSFSELSGNDILLVKSSKEASLKAYAPYSRFNVGAAILLENNQIITGNNQENAAYPSGLCAERVAVFSANAQFQDIPVIAVAITALKDSAFTLEPIMPCGACRQVLLETENRFGKPIKIILSGQNKILIFSSIKDLLPFGFGSNY